MRLRLPPVVVVLCLLACTKARAQRNVALLIGVDTYSWKPGTVPAQVPAEDRHGRFGDPFESGVEDLQGSGNDVASMRDLLIGRFGFASSDVHVLPDKEATDEAIRTRMQQYLVDERKPGDHVVFYWAGHGSFRFNSLGDKYNNLQLQLENTIVGSDANTGAYDVRDKEIRRIFDAAADKGVLVTAIFDSCHAGTLPQAGRYSKHTRTRSMPYDPRDIHEAPPQTTPPELRKDHPVMAIAAAGFDDLAGEGLMSDGKVHGVLTWALVKALREMPVDSPASAVFARTVALIASLRYEQNPTISQNARLNEPLIPSRTMLKVSAMPPAPVGRRATVTEVRGGEVVLDLGMLESLSAGSLLHALSGDGGDLVVTEVRGPDRSVARLAATGAGSRTLPAVGDQYALTRWRSGTSAGLKLWIGAALSDQQLIAALRSMDEMLYAENVRLIADPATATPQFVLRWTGTAWELRQHPAGALLFRSPVLDTRTMVAHLPSHGMNAVMIEVPQSQQTILSLMPAANEPFTVVKDLEQADYVLITTFAELGTHSAWLRRDVLTQGVVAPWQYEPEIGMCSAASMYPLRTLWQPEASQLHEALLHLAQVHAWLSLRPPSGASRALPFRLRAVVDGSNQPLQGARASMPSGKTLSFQLHTTLPPSDEELDPLRMYLVGISCTGEAKVLAGLDDSTTSPTDTVNADVPLRRHAWCAEQSFRSETFVLLGLKKEITDLSVFDFGPISSPVALDSSDEAVPRLRAGTKSLKEWGSGPPASFSDGAKPHGKPDWTVQYLRVWPGEGTGACPVKPGP